MGLGITFGGFITCPVVKHGGILNEAINDRIQIPVSTFRRDMGRKTARKRSVGRTVRAEVAMIKKRSNKMAKLMREYNVLRKEFLSRPENEMCAVFPNLRATEIHHKAKRGKNLLNVDTFLAVSREGHQWIEDNPKEARERGFTIGIYKL